MRRLLSLIKSLNKETFLESDKEPICSNNASCVGSYSSPSPILTIIQSVLFSLLILILKKWTANLRLSPINIDSTDSRNSAENKQTKLFLASGFLKWRTLGVTLGRFIWHSYWQFNMAGTRQEVLNFVEVNKKIKLFFSEHFCVSIGSRSWWILFFFFSFLAYGWREGCSSRMQNK